MAVWKIPSCRKHLLKLCLESKVPTLLRSNKGVLSGRINVSMTPEPYNCDLDPVTATSLKIYLFKNVRNVEAVRSNIQKGTWSCAIIKPSLILDPFQVAVAANRAVLARQHNSMVTRTVYAEILFNLSLSKNISQSLSKFGIETDQELLVCLLVTPERDDSGDIIPQIEGDLCPISELGSFTREQDVKQLQNNFDILHIANYKLNMLSGSISAAVSCSSSVGIGRCHIVSCPSSVGVCARITGRARDAGHRRPSELPVSARDTARVTAGPQSYLLARVTGRARDTAPVTAGPQNYLLARVIGRARDTARVTAGPQSYLLARVTGRARDTARVTAGPQSYLLARVTGSARDTARVTAGPQSYLLARVTGRARDTARVTAGPQNYLLARVTGRARDTARVTAGPQSYLLARVTGRALDTARVTAGPQS
ncbi:Prpk-binding protein [Operophtera brumata]|uniref:Prpk-binding protein n=1 Tax=Operophtera brumata TaxID=104452 RepID=A0A0L7LS24_OPEBR|nr:Prpk-binding protein [Operophtera brumata]